MLAYRQQNYALPDHVKSRFGNLTSPSLQDQQDQQDNPALLPTPSHPLQNALPANDRKSLEQLQMLYQDCPLPPDAAPPPTYDMQPFREAMEQYIARHRPPHAYANQAGRAADLATVEAVLAMKNPELGTLHKIVVSAFAECAGMTIGHTVEMLMLSVCQHPVLRAVAVSQPYVLVFLLADYIRQWAGGTDVDPSNRTSAPYMEKIAGSLANWNMVQPELTKRLTRPLAPLAKVLATGGINGIRDAAENLNRLGQLDRMDADAPAGPPKLTAMENLLVNALVCSLRNAFDVLRHGLKGLPVEKLYALLWNKGKEQPVANAAEKLAFKGLLSPQYAGIAPSLTTGVLVPGMTEAAQKNGPDEQPGGNGRSDPHQQFGPGSPFDPFTSGTAI